MSKIYLGDNGKNTSTPLLLIPDIDIKSLCACGIVPIGLSDV